MAFVSSSFKRCLLMSTHHLPASIFQESHNCCRYSSSFGNNNESTVIDFSTDPDERYNVYTYQLPLSDEQHGKVLETLNGASLKQLTDIKLSKSAAQKLIVARQKKGSFKHIRELLLVEGLGFKKIEAVCNHIVHFDVEHAKAGRHSRKQSRKLFVPEQLHHNVKKISSVVGLSLNGPALCWCLLQRSAIHPPVTSTGSPSPAHSNLGETASVQASTSSAASVLLSVQGSWRIANLNCQVLSHFKMELPTLYDQVCSALEEIPVCDCYVFSDKITVKAKMVVDELAASLIHAHIKGFLAVALNFRAGQEAPVSSSLRESSLGQDDVRDDPTVVYYAKEGLASKALVLKGPSRRLTGAVAASSLLSGCAPASLPGLTVPPEAVSVYNSLDTNQQYGLTAALLSALSFAVLSR